jgi:hypothetical protein
MPNIKISKIKTRRGTNEQLKTTALDQGEIVSTTDTKRLYIGTGSGYGGFVVGNKIHSPIVNYSSLTTLISEVGDIVNANNKYYQLTSADYTNITSWGDVSTKIDPILFNYTATNSITLNSNSISAAYIKSSTVLSGIKILNGVLQTDINTNSLEISSNKISMKAGGIGIREINSNSFGHGISGGSGDTISLNYDSSGLEIIGGKLALRSDGVGVREINSNSFGDGISGGSGGLIALRVEPSQFYFESSVLTLSSLPSYWIGDGLIYNSPVISTTLTNVDPTISKTNTGIIGLCAISMASSHQLAKVQIDEYGRTISNESAIFDVLTGNSSLSSFNSSNSLSTIFNGHPNQSLSGAIPGLQLANFTAISANGATITLSSAGFLLFDQPSTTRSGASVGRFAIPIFSY